MRREAEPVADRIRDELAELAGIVDPDASGWTRSALTDVDVAGREWVRGLMRRAGLDTRIDDAGNVIGVLPGTGRGDVLMLGSHTDTVPGGGRFDGNVGVLGAIEAVRTLAEAGVRLVHDLVVVDFFSEEPNRYGISCVGSRALTGSLAPEVFDRRDERGERFGDSLRRVGIDAARMQGARFDWSTVTAFLELHIEQGPYLEEMGTQIGVVERITGISRFHALFTGRRDHAGTTPMSRRRDAGCAAAGTVLAVERIAQRDPDGRGTTAAVTFSPPAINVVTELAEMRGEFRSPEGSWLREAETALTDAATLEASQRGVAVELEWLPTQEPVSMSARITRACAAAVDDLGLTRATLFSGAEHDAAVISRAVPTAMLFVPSRDGRSHCPEEWTELDDIVAGVHALTESVRRLDAVPPSGP